MEITLQPVTREEKETLINMYQFYCYEFSPYTHQELNQDGMFDANIDYLWEGDPRWNPFFIRQSGTIVGFLVVLFENMDTDPDPTHVIYDFLIMKKYRRSGIGRSAAIQAFMMYRANWAVVQLESNTPAISFWRNVISEFTQNHYTETFRKDRKKYMQEFSTKEIEA